MKELAGILDSAVYRLLITRLIPGATAISPFLWLAATKLSWFSCMWMNFRVEASLIVVFIISAAGLLIDDLGLKLENRHFDSLKAATKKSEQGRDLTAEWYQYLRIAFVHEPVGVGFMRQVLIMLKFEINIAVALVIASFGTVPLQLLWSWKLGLIVCFLCGAWFLGVHSAKESVDHLATLRFELLKGVREE